jgi:hypothetical protein
LEAHINSINSNTKNKKGYPFADQSTRIAITRKPGDLSIISPYHLKVNSYFVKLPRFAGFTKM